MSAPVFSAKLTPRLSTPQPDGTFVLEAEVVDHVGQFSGLDVQADDAILLDTFASVTAPSTVSRYRVVEVLSLDLRDVRVRVAYADTGAVVDPSEVLGTDGYIARTSPVYGLAWHAAPTLQGLPDYLVQYARNHETFTIIDNFVTANELPLSHQQATLRMGEPLSVGMLVAARADGVYRASPYDDARMRAVGVVTATNPEAGTCIVQTHGTVTGIFAGLASGAVYYVGALGFPDVEIANASGPVRVQAIGMALSATVLALSPAAVVIRKA